MKWVGYLGLLFAVLSTGLLGVLSNNASAVSYADTWLLNTDEIYTNNPNCNSNEKIYFTETLNDLFNDAQYWEDTGVQDTYKNALISAQNSGAVIVLMERAGTGTLTNSKNIRVIYSSAGFIFNYVGNRATVMTPVVDDIYSVSFRAHSAWGCIPRANPETVADGTNAPLHITTVGGEANEQTPVWYEIFLATGNMDFNFPAGYEGIIPKSGIATASEWKPDIKLLQGSDWLVELSDYNFFTFDKVAFTCGEHDLAPIINWEVWDVTDDENRVLIDTLIYGAPALVKYQAPKIQEDKRYEIVAYYSDCEGYTFAEASTKQFTVRKDGSLNPTDYMNVCIMETFPFINIPDCMAEINDLLAVLSFRVPEVNDLGNPGGGGGGQGWAGLVEGCRQLQVLDEWILSPDVVICPQMPSSIRNVVTPIVTFALALGVITFVVQRQGMRGISG